MISKRKLFDDNDPNEPAAPASGTLLKTNEKFAKKFDQREKHRLMQKGKLMEQDADEESSEYSDEDSDGILINNKVEQKFLETISRIRANDPALKKNKDEVFDDKDFELEKLAKMESNNQKPLTIKTMYVEQMKKRFGKDMLADINEENEEVMSEDSNQDHSDKPVKETDVAMQKRLKQEFLNAADSDNGSDSDILVQKPKTKQQLMQDAQEIEELVMKEHQKRLDADKMLAEFWGTGNDKQLTKEDKFLKSYILGEKWRENNDDYDEIADEEDLDRDSEIDEFEKNYNFRFEEPNGAEIKTYPRKIEDTYRIARNKRQQKKLEKKKRLKEYKEEKKREFEEIRAIKRKDILDKIEKTQYFIGDPKVSILICNLKYHTACSICL